MKLIVLVKRTELAKRFDLLCNAKPGDCGYDLKCTIDNPSGHIIIESKQYIDIPTGISVKLPDGYFAIIMPRSSVFTQKRGLRIHPGVIDNGFTGELKVLAVNESEDNIIVQDGERLAQLIMFPLVQAEFEEVEELPHTTRGSSGFGSTGR